MINIVIVVVVVVVKQKSIIRSNSGHLLLM